MYSREMGGIRSDGQLYGMQQPYEPPQPEPETDHPCEPPQKQGLFAGSRFSLQNLKNLKTEDLLLLGIGYLLLTDPNGENNELLLLLIGLLLLL